MNSERKLVLALDIGGTNFRLALIDTNGVLLRHHKERNYPEEGPKKAIKRIKEDIRQMLSGVETESIIGMGIGVAGLVTENGVLLTSPNMPAWYNTDLKAAFEKEPGFPAQVANDANLAALGEYRFGTGRGFDDLVYLTVSTGIGGGIIADGRLMTGSSGFAGELGHMSIDADGPLCQCGNRGCLEVMASGTAIARMAVEKLKPGVESMIMDLVDQELAKVTAEVVEKAARSGDELAGKIMAEAMRNLGVGVANLVHIFDPAIVIIGGGVARAAELLFGPVKAVVKERIMRDYKVEIVPSALGDESGLFGAVAMVLDSAGQVTG